MRTLLTFFVAFCVTSSLQGQGYIGFDNFGASAEQKVYIDEWLNPAALAPGGGQFLVALYFARIEDGESALAQLGSVVGFAGQPHERYGLFNGGERIAPTPPYGKPGFFQVKGWESAYGATYEEAAANPAARIGSSPIFIADTADRTIALEPVLGLVGNSFPDRPFRGFVIAVPEPSMVVLALVSVVTITPMLRRRKP
jgi:hypothetical protein